MTIHLDTSLIIEAITGARPQLSTLRKALSNGDRLVMSTLVMYEWLRGPRTPLDLEIQEQLCPAETVAQFGLAEAKRAADLYKMLKRSRAREMDIAIAACAIEHGAALWTQNPEDFRDIPGLRLYQP
jgi:predicted nucleic acid-binding protein